MSNSSYTYQIHSLLEKMNSNDKDFRFMATNDLMAELQKDSIKLDEDCERKVVRALLILLQDKNGEVQNLAVKCLGPLVHKVKESQVETIVDNLCSNMVSEKEQLRDISSMGLKTVIADLPSQHSASICRKITPKLIGAIMQQKDVTVQLESLEILSDLLNRFGSSLSSFHPQIHDALKIPLASHQRLALRKRAITALGHLVICCEEQLYNKIVNDLVDELLKAEKDYSFARTYVQCIGAVSRQSGHRFGKHLERVVPLIIQLSNIDDDELREFCIQALESFVRRSPKEVSVHISSIIQICLKYLSFDPNYNYDGDDEDDDPGMDMSGDDEDEDDSEGLTDDDDVSWKVRRAAAKALEAVISTRHDLVNDFYATVSPILILRFKEREENVKVDIFHVYVALLKQSKPIINSNFQMNRNHMADTGDEEMDHIDTAVVQLQQQVPLIVKSVNKLLREKSVKVRQGVFNLLTELVDVLPQCLTEHISQLIPGVLFSLGEKYSNSNMKIDTLLFLNVLLKNHPPEVFHPHVQILLPAIVNAVRDSFYKIASEGLLVLTQMVRVLRPEPPRVVTFNFEPYIETAYECTFKRLQVADIDQEVKERAIQCMGQILATFGDKMEATRLSSTLSVLLDRLRNEITRLTCVRALTKVASSPYKIDWHPLLPEAFSIFSQFLRKNQRALKMSTLVLLDTIVKHYPKYLTPDVAAVILNEVPPLISESDLHISQLTLNMLTSMIKTHNAFLPIIPQNILPETLVLMRSPLLQGAALNSMLEFMEVIVQSSFPGLDFNELLQRLVSPVYQPSHTHGVSIHKQAYITIAKCIAAVSVLDDKRGLQTVNLFVQDLRRHRDHESIQQLALLVIGEIGKRIDLTSLSDLRSTVLEYFLSPSEEVKAAASFALGSIAVGNLQVYLPVILQEIELRDKRQYMLLHSLKEIIDCLSVNQEMISLLEPHMDSIWTLLLHHCECPEEGTRNVVAECMGKLTLVKPNELLPRLKTNLASPSPYAKSTVVNAIKFTISDQPNSKMDPLLHANIKDFLTLGQDEDIYVLRVALVTFNSAAHNKPSLIRDRLDKLLPDLYKHTKIRHELVREVEMGPFKHTVDDGLDLRKAAFECMYTLLDSCINKLDIYEFLNHVQNGLDDHYDIKMLSYLMLARLAALAPSAVLEKLPSLVEPLKKTAVHKVKANSVKQEFEKQDELKRSALRAFKALQSIPDADKCQQVVDFMQQVKSIEELKALYDSIDKDPSSVNNIDSPMETN